MLAPSTYTDEDNILWNTLDFTSTKYRSETQFVKVSEVRKWITSDKHSSPPKTITQRPRSTITPQLLTNGPTNSEPPLRSNLKAPTTVPPQPLHKYDLRRHSTRARASFADSDIPAASAAIMFALAGRATKPASVADTPTMLPVPDAFVPPALNLDVHGKPLTYRSAKNGPDRLQ